MPHNVSGAIAPLLMVYTVGLITATAQLKGQSVTRSESARFDRSAVPAQWRQPRGGGPELGLTLSAALTTNHSDGAPTNRQFVQLAVSAGWTVAAGHDVAIRYVASVTPVAITTHDANYQFIPPPPCTGPCTGGPGRGTSLVTYHTAYGAGVAPLGVEFRFMRRAPVCFVVGANGGVLWFTRAVPQNNAAKFNFVAAGVAVLQLRTSAHTALRFGYQYHHTSNAHLAVANPGLNSSMLVLSVLREP